MNHNLKKPDWLKKKIPLSLNGDPSHMVSDSIRQKRLHTVCSSATCPNQNHCWSLQTATYLIGGNICTRNCLYCDIETGKPLPPDPNEAIRIAHSVKDLGIRHAVITSVNRDDLEDGGASLFYDTVMEIRKVDPEITIELLIPDFKGLESSLEKILHSNPDIINHNLESVRRILPLIAKQKDYELSLRVLAYFSMNIKRVKTGLMVGLGETLEEVLELMDDVLIAGVSMITIGQYLPPTPSHYPVQRYLEPGEFVNMKNLAIRKGIKKVDSGSWVRSSYHAQDLIK